MRSEKFDDDDKTTTVTTTTTNNNNNTLLFKDILIWQTLDCTVAIVTRLMVGWSGIRVRVTARAFIFFKTSSFLSGPFSLLLNEYRVICKG